MSFQQGLSGLNAASKSLETIGNNVANANTVGFKGSQAQFADVYANSLMGGGASQIGIGTKVADVMQQFTQGNITASANPLDVAINGGGFFRMSSNGTVTYGRNGQFQLDGQGFIVNSSGARLTGYTANLRGVLSTGAPAELRINTADIAPRATENVTARINLDSRMEKPVTGLFDVDDPTSYNSATSVTVFDTLGNPHILQTYYVKTDITPPATGGAWTVYAAADGQQIGYTAPVAPTTPPTGNFTLGVPAIGDIPAGTFSINGVSIGAITAGATAIVQGQNIANAINAAAITGVTASHDPATGAVTINNTGTTTVTLNGAAATAATAATNKTNFQNLTGFSAAQVGTQAVSTPIGTLRFRSADGTIDPTTTVPAPPMPFVASIPIAPSVGAQDPLTVDIDFAGTTQRGAAFSVNIEQDGYTSGRLSGFNIESNGIITGRYTNGKSATLGQVVLANFTNPNGLQPLGNNVWAETSESGSAQVGAPGSGNMGVLQSQAVEDSNVDLTAELVNMITAQRVYQANAQTIKTQDQVLQTLVNLR
ncbi:hypothetical protein GCM10027343_01050 [Noviherbaspirillum agri]